jgi:hypothetical protein
MQKILLFLFFTLATKLTIAQNVEVVSKSNVKLKSYAKDKASVFIHPKMDTSQLQFVATYKVSGNDSFAIPGDLFLLIKKQARKDGANFFNLKSFNYDSLKRPFISIDTYYGSEASIETNSSSYEINVIYIFSPEKIGTDTFSLKINNMTKIFNTTTYLKFVLKEGEELKLSKGGFTGARAKLKYQKDKPPIYLMVFGGTHLGGGQLPPLGTIGVTFNTGQIRDMTDDYGQFLVQILKQSE